MQANVDSNIRKILSANKVFFTDHGGHRYSDGDVIHFSEHGYVEPYCLILGGQVIPSIGSFSYTWSELPEDVVIGRYCSISWNVRVMYHNHPLDRISTSSFTYDRNCVIFSQALADSHADNFQYPVAPSSLARRNEAPIIENDVWIGQDVLLGRGITLGNGCVVGAGSVVTRSVPPFAIVGGNPARIIRYRFDEQTIDRILKLEWWNYKFIDFSGLPLDDVPKFIFELEKRIALDAIKPFDSPKVRIASLIAASHYSKLNS